MKPAVLELTGDANVPAMPMSDAEVNHLRRLLAWMRCEYMLDEHMQIGYLRGASEGVRLGFSTSEKASEIVQQAADRINHVPIYVRHAVKMLTKAVREHDANTGIVEGK